METQQRIRQVIKSQRPPYPPQGVLWIHEVNGEEVKEVWKNGTWTPVKSSGGSSGGGSIVFYAATDIDSGKYQTSPLSEEDDNTVIQLALNNPERLMDIILIDNVNYDSTIWMTKMLFISVEGNSEENITVEASVIGRSGVGMYSFVLAWRSNEA